METDRPAESWLAKLLRKRRERRLFVRSSPREVFTWIHRTNKWGDPESVSGSGSSLASTQRLRAELPGLLATLGVRTLLDAPCGDFHWMQHVQLPLERYVGVDIVRELVEAVAARHAAPEREFLCLDFTADPLPRCDAILCRDALVHLDYATIGRALDNFRRSGARYLLTTSHAAAGHNRDKLTGLHRPLDLRLPPFGWPEPLAAILEDERARGRPTGKLLGVWRMEDVRSPVNAPSG